MDSEVEATNGSDRFKIIVAVMIAVVTVMGALVAWRSALAGNAAGNADDAGIIAALNTQETTTLTSILSNQHRTAHVDYVRYRQLAQQMLEDGTLDNASEEERPAVIRQIVESLNLATASKQFFPSRYLDPDESYDIDREQGEEIAEAAQKKDLNAEQHFNEANLWRDRALALIGTLIVLGISLWLFAAAEVMEHRAKYALAAGGLAFLLIGSGAALAIELGTPVADVYSVSLWLSIVAGALVLLGALALVLMSRNRARTVDVSTVEERREERFKSAVTVLIASVALLTAIVAYLQSDAGNRGDSAIRRSQLLAAESLGAQTTGEAQVNYHYGGAAKAYEELEVLASLADEAGDDAGVARYRSAQERLTTLSEFLRPPYFDPNTQSVPDLAAYQADVYLADATTLSERSAIDSGLENAWEEKSNSYIVHLTLLATALALLGLSLTLSGVVRPLFVGAGSVMVVVTIAWASMVYTQPVPDVPNEAVEAYGEGVSLAYKGDDEEAIAAFDEALAVAPGYSNALYERGNSYSFMGDNAAAIRDYEAARAAGRDDVNVAWNLGWAYYLDGRFDDAIRIFQHAIQLDPKQPGVRLTLALSYLAAGRIDEARAEYKSATDVFTQQVNEAWAAGKEAPPSLWFYVDEATLDLESLLDRLSGVDRSWTQAPPADKVPNREAVQDAAGELAVEIKNLAVALEYTGERPGEAPTAEISPFQFGVEVEDQVVTAETFPYNTPEILTLFSYEGMEDGQQVVWKVYVEGEEYEEYRQAYEWDRGESGETRQTFTEDFAFSNVYSYDPGEYIIEMYVDSHLIQRGSFVVEAAPDGE